MDPRRRIVIDAGMYAIDPRSLNGVGLRARELYETLSRRYATALVAGTDTSWTVSEPRQIEDRLSTEKAIRQADVAIFFDAPVMERISLAKESGCRIVAECRPPIEHLSYPSLRAAADPVSKYAAIVAEFNAEIDAADHFICRSEAERAIMIGVLCARGRLTPDDSIRSQSLRHLLSVIPVGYSSASRSRAHGATAIPFADFVWTGGVWEFFQPELLIDAIGELERRGVLATAGYLHAVPTADTEETIARLKARAAKLGLEHRIVFPVGKISANERDAYLRTAKAFICVGRPNAENATATRLRLRDSYLHGVPIIVDPYGPTATIVEKECLGIVLSTADVAALADAMQEILRRPARFGESDPSKNYDVSARPLFDWIERVPARAAGEGENYDTGRREL